MRFLSSGLADLKLQLLYRIAESRNRQAPVNASSKTTESYKTIVCRAVEDRICKHFDLATRADLTDQQAIDALQLLIGIVRRSGLPIDFSPSEIGLMARGISYRMSSEPIAASGRDSAL
jgi:hypothetical protein